MLAETHTQTWTATAEEEMNTAQMSKEMPAHAAFRFNTLFTRTFTHVHSHMYIHTCTFTHVQLDSVLICTVTCIFTHCCSSVGHVSVYVKLAFEGMKGRKHWPQRDMTGHGHPKHKEQGNDEVVSQIRHGPV